MPIVPIEEFASDTNFVSGPAVGTATKTDPGSAAVAQGLVPGAAYPAQHLNFALNERDEKLNELVVNANGVEAALAKAAPPMFSRVDYTFAGADGQALAIHSPNTGDAETLLVKNGSDTDVRRVWGSGTTENRVTAGISPADTTDANLFAIARRSSQIVIVGNSTSSVVFSGDEGLNWTEGSSSFLGFTPTKVVANSSRFYMIEAGDDQVRSAGTWASTGSGTTNTTVSGSPTLDDIAASTSSVMVSDGLSTWVSNSTASVFVASTSLTSAGAGTNIARITGFGDTIYGLVVDLSNRQADLYKTTDATIGTWAPIGSLDSLFTGHSATMSGVELKICPLTGLMLLVAGFASSGGAPAYHLLFVSTNNGASWSRPVVNIATTSITSGYQCASGRIFVAPPGTSVMMSQRYL